MRLIRLIRLIRFNEEVIFTAVCIWMGWDWVGWMGCLSKVVGSLGAPSLINATISFKIFAFMSVHCKGM